MIKLKGVAVMIPNNVKSNLGPDGDYNIASLRRFGAAAVSVGQANDRMLRGFNFEPDSAEVRQLAGDAIANVLHWVESAGGNVAHVLQAAQGHYNSEREGGDETR